MLRYTIAALSLPLLVAGAYVTYEIYRKHRRKQRFMAQQKILLKMKDIVIVETVDEWNAIECRLNEEVSTLKVLGLDCEWAWENQQPRAVSLLQLATPSGQCVLIRLHKLEHVPDGLRSLLSNKGILKVGVGPYDDGQKLHRDYGLCVRGCVDLRYLARRNQTLLPKIRRYGLDGLSQAILDVPLDKDYTVRCGNWEAEQLSERQITYGALDALVGVQIFLTLVFSHLNKRNGSQNDVSLDGSHSKTDIWQKALSLCQGIVDVRYTRSGKQSLTQVGFKSVKGLDKLATRAYLTRQKPLYQNCQLQAPDGQPLCTCDEKKAAWYLDKKLGEKISDDPLVIRLTFEPSGRPVSDANYYLMEKENVCVVCGSSNSYIRKNIIPHEYRKYFPSVMKDHKSHDIVLMCTECHQHSNLYDSVFKDKLAEKCDAPLASSRGIKYTIDHQLSQVRSAAKALLTSSDKLPAARKVELEQILTEYYGAPFLDTDLLLDASQMDIKVANSEFVAHGEKVVVYMMENDGLLSFERSWRQHFLDTMRPQFLPKLWSVDHSHKRLAALGLGEPSTSSASS